MPTSVRLDAETESLLRRLARQKRLTKSAVIREAVASFARREKAARARKTPYEAAAHLIGSIKGLPPDLSERTGDRFYKMLLQQHRK